MKIKKLYLQIASGVLLFCLVISSVTLIKNKQESKNIQQRYSLEMKKIKEENDKLVTNNEQLKLDAVEKNNNSSKNQDAKMDQVAYKFINLYATYTTKNVAQKRSDLLKIATETVVNKIVPEQQVKDIESQMTTNKKDKNVYSSDLTFESRLLNSKVYKSNVSGKSNDYFAIVEYEVAGASGKSKQKVMLEYKIDTASDGKITVTDFDYHTEAN